MPTAVPQANKIMLFHSQSFTMKCLLATLVTTVLLWISYAWQPSTLILKTRESFKLAELQYLEISLLVKNTLDEQSANCRQILVDQATGSLLIEISCIDKYNALLKTLQNKCEWMGWSLAQHDDCLTTNGGSSSSSASVKNFVQQISERLEEYPIHPWSLEVKHFCDFHHRRQSHPKQQQSSSSSFSFTATDLICAVAQAIPVPPAVVVQQHPLDQHKSSTNLILINAQDKGLILVEKECTSIIIATPERGIFHQEFVHMWSKRPFLYSAAMNPTVTCMLVDILAQMVQRKREQPDASPSFVLLDPTCGSGSFLAYAMASSARAGGILRWSHLIGWDLNPKCMEGTKENLLYIQQQQHVQANKMLLESTGEGDHQDPPPSSPSISFDVQVRDSSTAAHPVLDQQISAVVANLPWGINTHIQINQSANKGTSSTTVDSHDAGRISSSSSSSSSSQETKEEELCASMKDLHRDILQSTHSLLAPGTPCAFVFPPYEEDDTTTDAQEAIRNMIKHSGYRIQGMAHIPPRNFELPHSRKTKKKNTNKKKRSTSDCVIVIAESL